MVLVLEQLTQHAGALTYGDLHTFLPYTTLVLASYTTVSQPAAILSGNGVELHSTAGSAEERLSGMPRQSSAGGFEALGRQVSGQL